MLSCTSVEIKSCRAKVLSVSACCQTAQRKLHTALTNVESLELTGSIGKPEKVRECR